MFASLAKVKKKHIEEFKGQTIGVDAMCWMHKGAYACARELVIGQPGFLRSEWMGKRVLTFLIGFSGGYSVFVDV